MMDQKQLEDIRRRIMSLSPRPTWIGVDPKDARALLAEVDELRIENKQLRAERDDYKERWQLSYWELDEHGGGWNECRWCRKGPLRYYTTKTYPHDENCPLYGYAGDYEY